MVDEVSEWIAPWKQNEKLSAKKKYFLGGKNISEYAHNVTW